MKIAQKTLDEISKEIYYNAPDFFRNPEAVKQFVSVEDLLNAPEFKSCRPFKNSLPIDRIYNPFLNFIIKKIYNLDDIEKQKIIKNIIKKNIKNILNEKLNNDIREAMKGDTSNILNKMEELVNKYKKTNEETLVLSIYEECKHCLNSNININNFIIEPIDSIFEATKKINFTNKSN